MDNESSINDCLLLAESRGNCNNISGSPIAIEHPEWGGDVVRNKDGTVKHPFDMMNVYLEVCLGVLCWFGFPLNVEVILRIVYDTNLRRKPQYIFQLSTTFSSLFTLLSIAIEVCRFFFWPNNEGICRTYMFLCGWSYCSFLFNFLLSLIDCCVAITFPLWHRRKATPNRIIVWLILLNLGLMFAMKWMFIFRLVPLCCAIQLGHALVIKWTLLIVFFLCVIFLCVDYVLTLHQLPRASRSIAVSLRRPIREDNELEMVDLIRPTAAIATATTVMSIHTPSDKTRRMESKATTTFLLDFVPLFLLPLPGLLLLCFYLTICPFFYKQEMCDDLVWLISPYTGVLFTIHAVVNPVLSLCLNKNFGNKPSPLRLLLISRSRRHHLMSML